MWETHFRTHQQMKGPNRVLRKHKSTGNIQLGIWQGLLWKTMSWVLEKKLN